MVSLSKLVRAGDAAAVLRFMEGGSVAPEVVEARDADLEGRTGLHVAVVDGRDDLVKLLLSHGADPNTLSVNGFTALALAVDFFQEDCVKILVRHYCNDPEHDRVPLLLDNVQETGSTFRKLVQSYPKDAKALLDSSRIVINAGKKKEDVSYDIAWFKPTVAGKRSGTVDNVLEVVASEHALDLCESASVTAAVSQLWDNFGQRQFYWEVFLYVLLLVSFVFSRVLNDELARFLATYIGGGAEHWAGSIADGSMLALSVYHYFFEAVEALTAGMTWVFGVPVPRYFASIWNCFDFTTYTLMTVLSVNRWLSLWDYSVQGSAVAAVLIWMKILPFAAIWPVTGPFVKAIGAMILDIFRFLGVFSVFWVGFSQAFHLLMGREYPLEYGTLPSSMVTMFRMMLAEYDFSLIQRSKYVTLITVLFLVYMTISAILLLNMLIALMENSFNNVADNAEQEALLSRVVALNRMEAHQPRSRRGLRDFAVEEKRVIEDDDDEDDDDDKADNGGATNGGKDRRSIERMDRRLLSIESRIGGIENHLDQLCTILASPSADPLIN